MADWSQSAAGLGQVFGKFMSGRDRFDDGMLQAAKIRKEQADALAGENKNGYIRSAIDAATSGNFPAANAYSVYGGTGKTGFDAAANGTVLNTITGGLDTGSSHAQAFANKLYQDAMAKQAQGMQYMSAAGLNDARAGQVAALTPYERDKLRANADALHWQAENYRAGADDHWASAAYRDQQRTNAADLLQYQRDNLASSADANYSQSANYRALADKYNAEVTAMAAKKDAPGFYEQERFKYLQENLPAPDEAAARAELGAMLRGYAGQQFIGGGSGADNAGKDDNPYGLSWPNRLLGVGRMYERLGVAPDSPVQPAGSGQLPPDIQQQAQAAIAAGADPTTVAARLKQLGYGGM